MARVVQRSGPPYLTILFVFLFFVSAALAGLFYNGWQTKVKELAKSEETLVGLASPSERNNESMAATKARAGRRSAVGQMQADIQSFIVGLAGPSAGQGMKVEEALAQIEAAQQAFDAAHPEETTIQGVLNILDRVGAKYMAAKEHEASLAAQNATLAADLEKARRDAADAGRILTGQLDEAKTELAALQTKLETLSGSYDQRVAAANSDWEGRVRDLQGTLSTRETEIRGLEKTVRDLTTRVAELEGIVAGEKRGPEAELKADGQILQVLPEHDLVYISLGRRNNIRVGLPFSVYAKQTGVSAEGQSKGRIIVKNVRDSIAECHIVRQAPGEPIVEGDLIANIAFSTVTQPKFYIVGYFDLNNDGQPDDDSLDAVRNMIARFGGSIVDEISVQTDYVVMGQAPRRASRPAPDAPATQMTLWQQNQQQADAYERTQDIAMRFNKPILNERQFMSFIGYSPEVLEP